MGRVEKRTYLCEGVAVATLLVPSPLPLSEGWERLAPLYERLAKEAEETFRTEAVPQAEQAYRESEDPHKRYRFLPVRGVYAHRITWDREGVLSVLRSFRVRRGEETLTEETHGEVWSRSGRLWFPSMVADKRALSAAARAGKLSRRRLESLDFYLTGGEAVFLRGKEEIRVPLLDAFLPFPVPEDRIRSPLAMLSHTEGSTDTNGKRRRRRAK